MSATWMCEAEFKFRMSNEEGISNDATDERDAREIAFWGEGENFIREEPNDSPKYDLEDRTARFGESVIDFALTIPKGPVTNRLIDQLVGCGTSVGANYCEADDAVSRKEFFLRIGKLPRANSGVKRESYTSFSAKSIEASKRAPRPIVIPSSFSICH